MTYSNKKRIRLLVAIPFAFVSTVFTANAIAFYRLANKIAGGDLDEIH